jgi:hypothetical protein
MDKSDRQYDQMSSQFTNYQMEKDGFYKDPRQNPKSIQEEYEDFIIDRYSTDYRSMNSMSQYSQISPYSSMNPYNNGNTFRDDPEYASKFKGIKNRVDSSLRQLENMQIPQLKKPRVFHA